MMPKIEVFNTNKDADKERLENLLMRKKAHDIVIKQIHTAAAATDYAIYHYVTVVYEEYDV